MAESIQDYVVAELQAVKGHWPDVSRESGVPYGTLKKIATEVGRRGSRIDTLEKLADYFRHRQSRRPLPAPSAEPVVIS